MQTRRSLLALAAAAAPAQTRRRPRILLRNCWQSVNIGDIGHAPGAISVLQKHFPEAEITLWPRDLKGSALEMMRRGYPDLKIVEGRLTAGGKPDTAELAKAWEETDLYLSGSGSGFPDSSHAAAFLRATGKPTGVFGVSTDPISGIGGDRDPEGGTLNQIRERAARLPPTHLPAELRFILDRAAFFFCRDTISAGYLKNQRVRTPVLEFGPDGQLGMHIRDDARGFAWMKAHGLEPGRFIVAIPRLRYTPYYRIRNVPRVPADDIRDAINNRTTERDHAGIREMIIAYVRNTGGKVMACGEMTYQVELAKEVLVDPLPAEIRRNVVWRDTFWLPDEAASIYSQAQCVVSLECHSPLIALRHGAPAFYVRQPTDTCKGQMYRDIGADDWLFEVEETSGAQLWERLQRIVGHPARARAKVRSIMTTVEARQKRMVDVVRSAVRA